MAQRCLLGKHRFEVAPGTGAGLQRKRCVNCGAVVIDLREDENLENPGGLFAPRRATVFSVSTQAEVPQEAFGRSRARH